MYIPQRDDIQEVRHECQKTASPGISGMETLERTAVPLPHVRPLLVAEVCTCLPTADADRVSWAATALRGPIPSWSKEANTGNRMINARAETVAAKPAWRTAFRKRHCLVPADGICEWRQTGSGKQPCYIRMRESGVFAFTGLWQCRTGYDERIESCSIIVTEASERRADYTPVTPLPCPGHGGLPRQQAGQQPGQ